MPTELDTKSPGRQLKPTLLPTQLLLFSAGIIVGVLTEYPGKLFVISSCVS